MNNLLDEGFCILKDVFTSSELQEAKSVVSDLLPFLEEDKEDPFELYYLRHRNDQGVLYDLFQRHPQFSKFVRNKEIISKLKAVLGESFFMYENSLVYKPAGKKNGVPFHQDFISRQDEPIKYIAWIALDDVTPNNGALKIIPGSHKDGFRDWYRVKGEAHHDRMDISSEEMELSKVVSLSAGDVLIFNQLLVHGSDEAHSDSLRLVYRVSYQSFEQIFTPRGTPIVVSGGKADELARYFTNSRLEEKKKTFLTRAVNKLGRVLSNV